MTKLYPICDCSRHILFRGAVNRIEAAFDENGYPSVVDELATLLATTEVEQKHRSVDLMFVMDLFCNQPDQLRPRELNWLYEEIWEIKFGVMRLVFTSAKCQYVDSSRSLRLAGHVEAPEFGTNTARATSLFVKNSESAPATEIRRARAIAREDKKHGSDEIH